MTSPCQLPGCSGMSQPSSWHTTHIRTRLHFSPHFSNHKTHLCLCISLVITKPNENVLLKRPVAPGANSPLKDSGPNSQAPAVLQPCWHSGANPAHFWEQLTLDPYLTLLGSFLTFTDNVVQTDFVSKGMREYKGEHRLPWIYRVEDTNL